MFDLENDELLNMTQWNRILGIRNEANKQIETARQNRVIGSSLDAEIKLYCDGNDYQLLEQLGQELKFLFITSAAEIHPLAQAPADAVQTDDQIYISISASEQTKCTRCWQRCADVKETAQGIICNRCLLNINGKGEERTYL